MVNHSLFVIYQKLFLEKIVEIGAICMLYLDLGTSDYIVNIFASHCSKIINIVIIALLQILH